MGLWSDWDCEAVLSCRWPVRRRVSHRLTNQPVQSRPTPHCGLSVLWLPPRPTSSGCGLSRWVTKWFVYGAAVHWTRPPTLDSRAGGHFDWEVVDDTDGRKVFHFRGTYLRIKAGERLVFSWRWQTLPIAGVEAPGNTTVRVVFAREGRSTRIQLTQLGLPNEAAREAHQRGWNRCLDGMTALLELERKRHQITSKT